MNFTTTEHVVLQGLIIFEFIFIIIVSKIVCMMFYLIVKVPQFHQNLIGLIENMAVAYFVLATSRLTQIMNASFDPILDSLDFSFDNMRLSYIMEQARKSAIYSYVFTILLVGIERTLSTIMLKTYQGFKHPLILIFIILIPWSGGIGIQFLITQGSLSSNLWAILMMCIICSSITWQLMLHCFNLYRYKHRTYIYYNLKERFQVCENIRFLKIIKWASVTTIIGDTIAILIYILLKRIDARYNYMGFKIVNFVIVFQSMMLPIITISTNHLWKNEFLKIVKRFVDKICPKNSKIEENFKVKESRFNAPYLKTLSGKPMVFSAEQEKELYFKHFQARL